MANVIVCAIVVGVVMLLIAAGLSSFVAIYSRRAKEKQDYRITSYGFRLAFTFGIGVNIIAILIVLLLLLQPLVKG